MEAPRFLLFVLFSVKMLVLSPVKVQNKALETFRQGKSTEYFEKTIPGARLKLCYSNLWNFKIPKRNKFTWTTNTERWISQEMAEIMLDIITRAHEIEANLNWQLEKDTIHICEKHFSEKQFYIGEFYVYLISYVSFWCRLLLLLVSCVTCCVTRIVATSSKEY